MMKFNLSLLAMLLVQGGTGIAGASAGMAYHADLHTGGWAVDASVFECRMVQQIPELGEAVFYHQAGESLQFYLQSAASPLQEGRALLTSLPPAWRNELPMRDLGYVDVVRGSQPLRLDASRSRLLLAELRRGMIPTVIRRAWYSDEESVQVGISPVRLGPVIQQYHDCVAGLLPVNFSQIERSTLFWEAGQTELDEESRRQLDDIATYVLADPAVHAMEINGFTDSSGTARENLDLSRRRAFLVHDYLVNSGVDEDMLSTRYFGSVADFRIIRDEQSDADRDRNRRVTVRLLRR